MGVEVVHHQDHFAGRWVVHRQQFFDEVGPVFLRSPLRHLEIAFAPQGFTGDEQIALPFLFIGIIFSAVLPRFGRFGRVLLLHQNFPHFIQAHHRLLLVIRAAVDIQHIFHAPHKIAAGARKTPLTLQPGTQFVFFSAKRTVSSLI